MYVSKYKKNSVYITLSVCPRWNLLQIAIQIKLSLNKAINPQ